MGSIAETSSSYILNQPNNPTPKCGSGGDWSDAFADKSENERSGAFECRQAQESKQVKDSPPESEAESFGKCSWRLAFASSSDRSMPSLPGSDDGSSECVVSGYCLPPELICHRTMDDLSSGSRHALIVRFLAWTLT